MSREMNEIYGTVLESNVYIRKYKAQSIGIKLFLDKSLNAKFVNSTALIVVNLCYPKYENTWKDIIVNSNKKDALI